MKFLFFQLKEQLCNKLLVQKRASSYCAVPCTEARQQLELCKAQLYSPHKQKWFVKGRHFWAQLFSPHNQRFVKGKHF